MNSTCKESNTKHWNGNDRSLDFKERSKLWYLISLQKLDMKALKLDFKPVSIPSLSATS